MGIVLGYFVTHTTRLLVAQCCTHSYVESKSSGEDSNNEKVFLRNFRLLENQYFVTP